MGGDAGGNAGLDRRVGDTWAALWWLGSLEQPLGWWSLLRTHHMLCTNPFGVHRAERAATGTQVEVDGLISVWDKLNIVAEHTKHSPGCGHRAFPAGIHEQPCGLKQQLSLEPVVRGGGEAAPLPMAQARFWYLHCW